jgi:ATP phosphoribosyltransferase regulatory subunit
LSKWKIYTPEGVQDILFEECYAKRCLEEKIRTLFGTYGYFEIETPAIEFFDVFSSEEGLTPQETMFKFFDQQGRILVLRPDMTVPAARITATKYRDINYPIKYSYIGNVFRYNEHGGGKQNEFTQAGVEIMGVSTPESDAEVIAIAINSLITAGLESFQVDIGQVEFFKGLMEETELSEEEVDKIRILIEKKDFVGVGELVKRFDIREDLKNLILSLPGLFGSTDVIDKVKKVTQNPRSLNALENIRQVLEILDDYGLSKYVSVDLGMLKGLNYDTGIIFRGFTYDVGFPVLTGGRYDNLVEKFGRKCPATGFSLGINMIMTALERQKIEMEKPQADSLVCYNKNGRKKALEVCAELRKQGLKVEMDISGNNINSAITYAKNKNIGGIIYVIDNENIEVHNVLNGEVNKTSISELMKL